MELVVKKQKNFRQDKFTLQQAVLDTEKPEEKYSWFWTLKQSTRRYQHKQMGKPCDLHWALSFSKGKKKKRREYLPGSIRNILVGYYKTNKNFAKKTKSQDSKHSKNK